MGQKQRKRKARTEASKTRETVSVRSREAVPPVEFSLQGGLIAAGLAALVAILYAQVRHFDFVYLDDPVYVYDNPMVKQGLSMAGVRWAMTTQAAGNWHPLTWVSHMADVSMYGLNAGRHHLTSVIFHILNTILLFAAAYRMTGGLWKSAVVAALFAVHPLHVESVAWVAERKDVLSAFFWMLTIHAYVSYVRKGKAWRYTLVVLFFALGLMAKPMVVTLPFTLLLLDYWPLERISSKEVTQLKAWWQLVREKVPLFALTVFSMVVTVKVQRGFGAVVKLEQLPVATRVGNAMVAYVDYMRDLIWPARLAAFYPFHPHSAATTAIAAIILIGISALALVHARRRPYLLIGWLWYLGTLVPAIGLVQVGDQARADRYTYIPAIGLFVILVWGLYELTSRLRFPKAALGIAAAVGIAACAWISMRQVGYWRTNLTLFSRAIAVTDRNYRAEALLGVAYSAKNQHAEAIKHYRQSLGIWAGNAEVHSNLGASLYALGKVDESLHEFSEAVRYKPQTALYHYNYGVMLNEKGRAEEGLVEVRTATELDPLNKPYRDALNLLMSKQKR